MALMDRFDLFHGNSFTTRCSHVLELKPSTLVAISISQLFRNFGDKIDAGVHVLRV